MLAGMTACLGALGFDEVEQAPADVDGDGLVIDNCRDVANADQADGDGDGLGDVCDPCPAGAQTFVDADRDLVDDGCDACFGPRHDEDGDAIDDACDTCPVDPDPTNADTDQDGVGDVCDIVKLVPGQQKRFFDGFAPPDLRWRATGADWLATGDAVSAPVPTANAERFRSPTMQLRGQQWQVETAFELAPGLEAGIQLDRAALGNVATCQALCTMDSCVLVLTTVGKLESPERLAPPQGRLRMRLRQRSVAPAGLGFELICESVDNPAFAVATRIDQDQHDGLSLAARSAASFEYVYAAD